MRDLSVIYSVQLHIYSIGFQVRTNICQLLEPLCFGPSKFEQSFYIFIVISAIQQLIWVPKHSWSALTCWQNKLIYIVQQILLTPCHLNCSTNNVQLIAIKYAALSNNKWPKVCALAMKNAVHWKVVFALLKQPTYKFSICWAAAA